MIIDGEIWNTAYNTTREGRKYLMLRIRTVDRDYFVSVVPWVRWSYKEQLLKMGVDLQVFYEWDGVDLVDKMFPSLGSLVPGKKVKLNITLVRFRGKDTFKADLI